MPSRIWKLGEQEVPETSQYKHLGITIESDMALNTVTKEASTKLKATFLSLVNCGLHEDGFTPLTAKHIYKSIVLPKALYGCEVWSQLSPTQLSTLERAHRFCVKFMQSLPSNTDTDVTLPLLGLNSIELEIDYRKMVFWGQLCRLPSDCTIKQIFMHRLSHYTKNSHLQRGFIPDIYRILGKYS